MYKTLFGIWMVCSFCRSSPRVVRLLSLDIWSRMGEHMQHQVVRHRATAFRSVSRIIWKGRVGFSYKSKSARRTFHKYNRLASATFWTLLVLLSAYISIATSAIFLIPSHPWSNQSLGSQKKNTLAPSFKPTPGYLDEPSPDLSTHGRQEQAPQIQRLLQAAGQAMEEARPGNDLQGRRQVRPARRVGSRATPPTARRQVQ